MPIVEYSPLPTLSRFLRSEALYNVCCGARGSGKTTAGLMRTILLARQADPKYYPLRWAVIRDTRKAIGLTLAKTIKAWLPEPYAKWRGKEEEPESCDIYLGGKGTLEHILHFDFFGVNSPADHSRFQSYEASGGVWIEEPCPLKTNTEVLSTGVGESVLATAVTCLRAAPRPSVQLTMNPPSGDFWVAQLWKLPGSEPFSDLELDMGEGQLAARESIREQSAVFMVPMEENSAELVSRGYVQRNRDILLATGDKALYARLVEGRVGSVDVGVRVAPEFGGHHIVSQLPVLANVPAILAFDYGLNPTCIVAQVTPTGYLNVLKAWSRPNVGIRQLLELDVQPWLGQAGIRQYWYCGGAEAREREQSDSEETALKVILRTLGTARYATAPVSWSARRQALKEALTRSPQGFPWVRIAQEGCANLIRCLDGGWAYATDASEQVRNETVPPKNRYSHLGDAMCALCAVLLRKTDPDARPVGARSQGVRYPTHPGSLRQGQTRTRV